MFLVPGIVAKIVAAWGCFWWIRVGWFGGGGGCIGYSGGAFALSGPRVSYGVILEADAWSPLAGGRGLDGGVKG